MLWTFQIKSSISAHNVIVSKSSRCWFRLCCCFATVNLNSRWRSSRQKRSGEIWNLTSTRHWLSDSLTSSCFNCQSTWIAFPFRELSKSTQTYWWILSLTAYNIAITKVVKIENVEREIVKKNKNFSHVSHRQAPSAEDKTFETHYEGSQHNRFIYK